jgi:hypothetical protein
MPSYRQIEHILDVTRYVVPSLCPPPSRTPQHTGGRHANEPGCPEKNLKNVLKYQYYINLMQKTTRERESVVYWYSIQ